MSKQFEVSLMAAAVRCVKVTDWYMLVMSKQGMVKSFEKGQNFGGQIEMGELPADSLAAQLGWKEREKKGTINASVWLGSAYEEYRMTEHSILMENYEHILTLLVH